MERVIFACVHNAGRLQMAAAFFSALSDPAKAVAVSAGTQPGEHVHPEVVSIMSEVGIDLSSRRPQKTTSALAEGASVLVTMGCGDECPYVPGLRRDDWSLEDPKGKPLEDVRRIRDEIRDRVARHPDALGRGCGTALYTALFAALEHEDGHTIVAAVSLPNPASLFFHERFGFRRVGVFHAVGRKFDQFWDVAWFERSLR